jgi:hypothetical protein
MDSSILLSKIIWPLFIIISLSLIINTSNYKKMFKGITKDSLVLFISGFMSFIIWMLMILYHNIWWVWWYTLITLLWYIALIKWISILMFPNLIIKISKKITLNKSLIKSIWLIYLGLWVYISYLWYFY